MPLVAASPLSPRAGTPWGTSASCTCPSGVREGGGAAGDGSFRNQSADAVNGDGPTSMWPACGVLGACVPLLCAGLGVNTLRGGPRGGLGMIF